MNQEQSQVEEFHAHVTGRVQMVMFRDFAQRKARGLKLVGSVQNLPDGSVEVVAQGERSILEQFLAKLQRGSLLSHVERVEAEWRPLSERQFDDFHIIY